MRRPSLLPPLDTSESRALVIGAWVALAAFIIVYVAIFWGSYPGADGRLGSDYALHFPNMLVGWFHMLANGPFSVPWFNPSLCGGVPYLADLNVGYYSVPQWLSFEVGPLVAVQATFVGFAALGAIGAYLLARSRFELSIPAALATAVIFLFNGFYAYRMAVGHLTFHPFMLAPWAAFVILPPIRVVAATYWTAARIALSSVLFGAIFAYSFQAGMIHAIIPMAISVAVIALIHGYLKGEAWQPWAIFGIGTAFALALSATRIAAVGQLSLAFTRDLYPLAGIANPIRLVRSALEFLFIGAPKMFELDNSRWVLGSAEWEYSVGPVVALLLVAGAVALVLGRRRRDAKQKEGRRRSRATLVIIVVLLALPLLVNWYGPAWNAVLKQVPLLESSTTLVRWFATYIPIAALCAGLALDRLTSVRWQRFALLGVVAVGTIGWTLATDPGRYKGDYAPGDILAAWSKTKSVADIPPISRVDVMRDPNSPGRVVIEPWRNDALIEGTSQIICYEPLFGYQLELFPKGELTEGTILDKVPSGDLNIKNPACYLFPNENACAPGDHFRADQVNDVIQFAQYYDYPFQRSPVQIAADWINVIALAGALAVLVWAVADAILRRRRAA